MALEHRPVLLREVVGHLPTADKSPMRLLDVTAGGGGHFFAILESDGRWKGECWDRDPAAEERIAAAAKARDLQARTRFERRSFSEEAAAGSSYDFILADIGISSFQVDDPSRGMSLHSEQAPDFRMDPGWGPAFEVWLRTQSESDLADVFFEYGEEPRAKRLARAFKKEFGAADYASAKILAGRIAAVLGYKGSRVHPATRAFQALRIAINDEIGQLRALLDWAPRHLSAGGRLAIISFHSIEDREVKTAFRALAAAGDFVILTKKPLVADEAETAANPRSRSAKLRVLERSRG